MKNKFFSFNLDFLGFSASFLCAIHCALLPILLTYGALSGLEFLEAPEVEYTMIILSFVIASVALRQGYKNHHQNLLPFIIVIAGFLAIGVSRIEISEFFEGALMTMGGILIATSHVVNWKKMKKCTAEACAH